MNKAGHFRIKFDTHEFSILSPIPPFVDILLKYSDIDHKEFEKIKQGTTEYSNDPRLIEMVRQAGDASAKVPYLLDESESAESILGTLREIAVSACGVCPSITRTCSVYDPDVTFHQSTSGGFGISWHPGVIRN